ncbi:hypothetical protein M1O29_00895, partial [Dehalococcoidia bacterium]|nr:hypothetical protein [Dehalococcoidia bacterium]MCL0101627.1 hypothetical protein [Dehalococcoidia bacterium]
MKRSLKVIDTTRHVLEPIDLWDKHIEKPYQGSGIVQVDPSSGILCVNGRPVNETRSQIATSPLYKKAFA